MRVSLWLLVFHLWVSRTITECFRLLLLLRRGRKFRHWQLGNALLWILSSISRCTTRPGTAWSAFFKAKPSGSTSSCGRSILFPGGCSYRSLPWISKILLKFPASCPGNRSTSGMAPNWSLPTLDRSGPCTCRIENLPSYTLFEACWKGTRNPISTCTCNSSICKCFKSIFYLQ